MRYDFLIVGAGLSGSVIAERLKSAGAKILVLDKRDVLGGNLRCRDMGGITVHCYGAHIFRTSNPIVWEYVNRFATFNRFTNSPVANYRGQLYNLPFNMNTFHQLFGVNTPKEARAVIDADRIRCANPKNLEEHVLDMVGETIYERLVRGYTEKQWGKKCTELPPSIIRRIPVRLTYDNNYFHDRWQGIPENGYNDMISKMLSDVPVELLTDFNDNREYWEARADKVVYTGPVDALCDYAFGPLEYRSLRFEHERIEENNHQGVAVINYTDNETPYTRTIEHKHFLFGDNRNYTIVTKEYPCEYVLNGDTEPYYPIENEINKTLYKAYKDIAEGKGYILCGRLAEYRYYDMQDTIASALSVTDKIIKG